MRYIVAFALLLVPNAVMAQLSVNPVSVVLDEDTNRATITVSNTSQQPVDARVYSEAFGHSEADGHWFLPSSEGPDACRDRLTISPSQVSLGAGEQREVFVDMSPAEDPCWEMLWIHSMTPVLTSTGASATTRIGTMIAGQSTHATPDLQLIRSDVVTEGDGIARMIRLHLQNEGDAMVRPTAKLEVWSTAGDVLHRLSPHRFTVLPFSDRVISVPVPDLSEGEYILVPIVDGGGDFLLADRLEISIGG